MTEPLPSVIPLGPPPGTPTGAPDVLVAALAQAAAAIAERERPPRPGPEREVVRECAREVMAETFKLFGVDLGDLASVQEFREDLTHMRRARRERDKAFGILFNTVLVTIAGAIVAAVGKYVMAGGGK